MGESFSIAQVTPYPWEQGHDVNRYVELDFVHVHEPFAPSAASAALRHSRTLNVGTFHGTSERFLSTQVARRVVQLLFGRLDARTATSFS